MTKREEADNGFVADLKTFRKSMVGTVARAKRSDRDAVHLQVRLLLPLTIRGRTMGNFVRLLGFTTLPCGCVVGRYRELATNRDVNYVEEKGKTCESHAHRRNHTLAERIGGPILSALRSA